LVKQTGVKAEKIDISDAALNKLIKYYCRESGVRNLQKHIEKIFRKVAFKLVSEKLENVNVTDTNLPELVGNKLINKNDLS
jgi:Lon-like ATP-dependent protease